MVSFASFFVPSSSSLLFCNLLAKSSRIISFPAYPFDFESLTLVSTPSCYNIFTLYSKYSPYFELNFCGHNNQGTFSVIAGLLCLGCGRMSFVNQMSRKNVVRQPKVLLWMYTWTAATRLPTAAYGALRDAFIAKTSGVPRAPSVSIFDTCYHLYFSGGPILTLASYGFLIPAAGVETVCFAFAPSASALSVIGNVQQTGIQISIDEAGGYIGFGPNVC